MIKKLSGTMIVAAFMLVTASIAAPAFAKDAKESVSKVFNKVSEGKVLSASASQLTIKSDGKMVTFTLVPGTKVQGGPIEIGDEVKIKTTKDPLVADTIKVEKKDKSHYGHDNDNDGDNNHDNHDDKNDKKDSKNEKRN